MQVRVGDGVLVGELGIAQLVLRLFVVDQRHHAALLRLLGAAHLAATGDDGDFGEVRGLALLERLLPGVDALPPELEPALCERGLGLLELVLELRAVDDGQHLAGHHRLAGVGLQRDRAGGGRVERRADRRHHTALHRDVADELAARHGGSTDTFVGHADAGVGPARHRRRRNDDQRKGDDRNSREYQALTARIGRRELHVLRRGVGNAHCIFSLSGLRQVRGPSDRFGGWMRRVRVWFTWAGRHSSRAAAVSDPAARESACRGIDRDPGQPCALQVMCPPGPGSAKAGYAGGIRPGTFVTPMKCSGGGGNR